MKNKWLKTMTAALAVSCTVGCGTKEPEGETPKEIEAVYAENDSWVEEVSQKQDLMMPERQQGESAKTLDEELFDGQSMRIWNGKGNMLLAIKEDILYLYDVSSARIKAETRTENWNLVTFYPYSNGYCAIGTVRKEKPDGDTGTEAGAMMLAESDGEGTDCLGIFYDDSLKEVRKILLNDIVPNADMDVWAVSSDGSAIGYYDQWEGLNIYEPESQTRKKLLDPWKEGDGIDILSIDALFFDEKNRHMIFTGQMYQDGGTVASWGRIGTDGTGIESYALEHDFGIAAGYSGGKLLIGEDSIYFEGGMGIINTETKETAYHTDIDRTLPVSGPFFSADGTVFATAALDTNQMEVSLWQTADFSLLYKEVIRDDREEMFYRSPQICLFPEIRACIVCMGGHNDIPQEAVLVNY